MTGRKARSCYRPTRKGKGFGGCKRKLKYKEKTLSEEREFDGANPTTTHKEPDTPDSDEHDKQPLNSSAKKMKLYDSKVESLDETIDVSIEQSEPYGYRLINLTNHSSSISVAHKCDKGNCKSDFLKLCIVFPSRRMKRIQ